MYDKLKKSASQREAGETEGVSGMETAVEHYSVRGIHRGSYFTQPVFLDDEFILVPPEMPFTEEMADSLIKWQFREVLSTGEPLEDPRSEAEDADSEEETGKGKVILSDQDAIKRAKDFYSRFIQYAEELFTQVAIKNRLDFKEVALKMKEVCEVVKEDRRFLLRVQKVLDPKSDQNYLTSHAVKSTVIALVIGSYLKLPLHRLVELGTAALLHEIGMIKLPPQIYLNKRALSPPERTAILTHPILSYELLKSFEFPLSISMAALEHHERENGEGYPRKLTGDKISLYAKIIAVACSYEALTTKRPHREAKDGYTGMLDLLKNEGNQYDDTVIRALVYSLSIYPIGLYVLLSNGKQAQVIDVNPEKPRYPIVQILGELTPEGRNKTLETSHSEVHITRPLKREEIGRP
jgi:HD-GYP domain-containing protein (c-di-GMP phosphodiesterase class II)